LVTQVRGSVFVIDDDPRLLRLLGLIFRISGYQVHPFSSATQALNALRGPVVPDLIVVDLLMPEMDGRHFVRELQASGINVPVVISSAYGAYAAQRELGTEGAIEKPFSPEDLLRLVEDLLTRRRGGRHPESGAARPDC
jgi:CheY-like chemotaxis protein